MEFKIHPVERHVDYLCYGRYFVYFYGNLQQYKLIPKSLPNVRYIKRDWDSYTKDAYCGYYPVSYRHRKFIPVFDGKPFREQKFFTRFTACTEYTLKHYRERKLLCYHSVMSIDELQDCLLNFGNHKKAVELVAKFILKNDTHLICFAGKDNLFIESNAGDDSIGFTYFNLYEINEIYCFYTSRSLKHIFKSGVL